LEAGRRPDSGGGGPQAGGTAAPTGQRAPKGAARVMDARQDSRDFLSAESLVGEGNDEEFFVRTLLLTPCPITASGSIDATAQPRRPVHEFKLHDVYV